VDDTGVLLFFGALAPISAPVHYAGEEWAAEWHILDYEERCTLDERVARVPLIHQEKARKVIRIAMALRKVNGRRVTFHGEDEQEEFLARMQWLDTYPEPFVDAVYYSYQLAEQKPVVRRQQLSQDPNASAPSHGGNGDTSATADTSTVPTAG